MSMQPHLSDAERADLVAYLDGELGGEQARVVEARISQDPKIRAEAEALAKSWELLDFLPRPEPSPNFTHRTLDRISAPQKLIQVPGRRPWRMVLFGVGWAAAVVLAVLGGYALVSFLAPADRTDIEFLRELDRADLFGDDNSGPLDHDLHEEDSPAQARLVRTADRYFSWLDHLPEDKRARIKAAADTRERLKVIRDVREQEWIDRLPRAQREQVLAATSPTQRASLISRFRDEERQRHLEWQRVLQASEPPVKRFQPVRVADLPWEARTYVEGPLAQQLTPEEKERLQQAEGKWPLFARTLLELTDKHPTGLPGPSTGPRHHKDLPERVKERLQFPRRLKESERERLKQHEGKWPEYAITVTEILRGKGGMPEELGPARLEKLPEPVREFVEKKLLPQLTSKEKEHLKTAEGRWPDYPRAILDLARAHGLVVPGMPHPSGPPGFWDGLRRSTAAASLVPTMRD